jgi:DNA polymerase elongation subunit (family B)
MLINMGNLRKEFRAKLKEFKKGSEQFDFYNARQLAVKVIMNSSYGTYGLSSFRYSNHWLAQSITSQGRLTIKLAQYMTEQFLRNKYTS